MIPVLISACLLGQCCRYDGQTKEYPSIAPLIVAEGIQLIPVCPEQMGGLATPREPAEQSDGRVVTATGTDVTRQYNSGAGQVLRLAKLFHCRWAVLKEKSPSCGCGRIYDGTFSRHLVAGDGVTAHLLQQSGLHIVGETDEAGLQRLLELDQ